MKVFITAMTTTALLAALGAPLAAHENFRIVGTVTKVTAGEITVKQSKDGQLVEMDIDKQTKVTKDKKPMTISDVKAGGSVVVDAYGDSILDLLVLEIRLVPAIPKPARSHSTARSPVPPGGWGAGQGR